jgi:hypothetical protein
MDAMAALDPKGDPVGTMAQLAPLLRRCIEARIGESRQAATDDEWSRWIEASGRAETLELRRESAELLRVLTEVRYGGSSPTRFAAEEARDRAMALARADAWNGGGGTA